MIHVDQGATLALNKTCKLCPSCDLLIAHQDEIEAHLAAYFGQHAPDVPDVRIGTSFALVLQLAHDASDAMKALFASFSR